MCNEFGAKTNLSIIEGLMEIPGYEDLNCGPWGGETIWYIVGGLSIQFQILLYKL